MLLSLFRLYVNVGKTDCAMRWEFRGVPAVRGGGDAGRYRLVLDTVRIPNFRTAVSLFLLLAVSAAWCEKSAEAQGNLIPKAGATTPNYWCTWGSQNYAVDRETAHELMNHSRIAANLTEDRVFGVQGWAHAFGKARKDMYILFDLGWDVPSGTEFDHARWKLGSQVVAVDKFPSCTGTPMERLRKLNTLARRAGWRGAGIWIAAQALGDGRDRAMLPHAEVEKFFRERLKWSHEAGIGYWKIDYGSRNTAEFRRMVTRLAAQIAPELVVENARGSCPLNDVFCPWEEKLSSHNSGEFREWGDGSVLKDSAEIAAFSPVFRTYDITERFSTATTLDRVAQMLAVLAPNAEARGILNCEDEPYIAAGLGLAMGIMRHPQWKTEKDLGTEYDPRDFRLRIDEVIRAVRWQRIAPAFAAGGTVVSLDGKRLDDTWVFKKGETWADWVTGKKIVQGAPARVSRGMKLAAVSGGDAPFVISSRNPNGAVSVATLPRLEANRGFYFPLADVSLDLDTTSGPVGVFGHYKTLTLRIPHTASRLRILAQDLAGDTAQDITGIVEIRGNEIVIPGEVIDRVGTSAGEPGDVSDPGLVIRMYQRKGRAS
jgi:hypothetical protein